MFYSFYRGIQSDISTRFHPLKLYCSELEPPENGPAKVEVQHRATLSQLRQNVFFSYRVSGILEPVQKYRDTFIYKTKKKKILDFPSPEVIHS